MELFEPLGPQGNSCRLGASTPEGKGQPCKQVARWMLPRLGALCVAREAYHDGSKD